MHRLSLLSLSMPALLMGGGAASALEGRRQGPSMTSTASAPAGVGILPLSVLVSSVALADGRHSTIQRLLGLQGLGPTPRASSVNVGGTTLSAALVLLGQVTVLGQADIQAVLGQEIPFGVERVSRHPVAMSAGSPVPFSVRSRVSMAILPRAVRAGDLSLGIRLDDTADHAGAGRASETGDAGRLLGGSHGQVSRAGMDGLDRAWQGEVHVPSDGTGILAVRSGADVYNVVTFGSGAV